ncbi:MAG: hypothetical protein BGO69_04540 [Bacteroidetes bacterium 46-16]|nr:MAG: hypothetical protein BGO69_04540 [Bacteroidetes bacterium 46-16]
MKIAVAGPYTAHTQEQRERNLEAMNKAAARLLEMGHIPLVGVNAALPVVQQAHIADNYKAIMDISLALIDNCEAILVLGDSPGVQQEKDLLSGKGLPVYYSMDEIPR